MASRGCLRYAVILAKIFLQGLHDVLENDFSVKFIVNDGNICEDE
jgi:hypothetical protein